MKNILKRLICWWRGHAWTCKAGERIPPTGDELTSWEGVKKYATMYCKRCGRISSLNNRLKP